MTAAAGLASVINNDYYMSNGGSIMETRQWTRSHLEELGFEVIDSKANFLFVKSDRIDGEETVPGAQRKRHTDKTLHKRQDRSVQPCFHRDNESDGSIHKSGGNYSGGTEMMRTSEIKRTTGETDISLKLCLDGTGSSVCQTGCGFLDHMLTLFSKHGRFDLEVRCSGDTYVDYHHTTEDIGICLGSAFADALGDKKGITRYSSVILPMDEALILSAVDISGRGGFYPQLDIPTEKVGNFDTELCEGFCGFFEKQRRHPACKADGRHELPSYHRRSVQSCGQEHEGCGGC